MPLYLILPIHILFLLFNCDPKDLLESFPRDGLIALLAAFLALFLPIAILVVERSKNDSAFPWEEEMTISRIAHPKVLFISVIGASVSCILWNKISANTHILPFILMTYVACIVALCWILGELYRWLLSITAGKNFKDGFRSKQITKYFKDIKTDEDRIRVWPITFNKIESSTPAEQALLVKLYLDALCQHADNISYYTLTNCFIENISKLDIRDFKSILEYSLTSITSERTNPFHRSMDERLLSSMLSTLKDENIFIMEFAYDAIQKCRTEKQSYMMTKKIACRFFTILAQEDYAVQDVIIDSFLYSCKWGFRNLIIAPENKKLYTQTHLWLSEYVRWLVDQYVRQFGIGEIDKYYNGRIIEKISEGLFRNCDIDQQMFADIILFYCPVGYTPQPGESDAETHVRAFVETASRRNFMNKKLANTDDKIKGNTIKLLSIAAPLAKKDSTAYIDAINSYKQKIAKGQKRKADYGYKIDQIARLERYFKGIQKK